MIHRSDEKIRASCLASSGLGFWGDRFSGGSWLAFLSCMYGSKVGYDIGRRVSAHMQTIHIITLSMTQTES